MLFHDKNIEYWLIYNPGRFFFYLYTYSDCKNIYITVTFILVRFSFTKVNLQGLKSRVAHLYF